MTSYISNQDLNILSIIHQPSKPSKTCFFSVRVWLWIEMDCCWLWDQIRWLLVIIHVHIVHMWDRGACKLEIFIYHYSVLRLEVTFKCSTTKREPSTLLSTAMVLSSGDPQVGSDCTEWGSCNVSIYSQVFAWEADTPTPWILGLTVWGSSDTNDESGRVSYINQLL